jgi:hypothetical protein
VIIGAEERLAASMKQIRREVFRLGRSQQALFAFVDSLAKVLLTCVPEPGGEALDAAVARARGCHAQLLKSAGQSMVGDSQLAMQDLVVRGEGFVFQECCPAPQRGKGRYESTRFAWCFRGCVIFALLLVMR